MPPHSSSIWQCARGAASPWPRGGQRLQLPIRSISTGSAARKIPSAPSATSTPTAQADRSDLPPESPKYIFMPRAPQPDNFVRRRMKGVLPRPRHPFKRHKTRDQPAELAAATPEPSRRSTPTSAHWPGTERARLEAKASLAAQRRALLRQGTQELKARYEREANMFVGKQQRNAAAAAIRLTAPELDAERLTAPTVLARAQSAAMQPDAAAGAKLAVRRAQYAAAQAANRARRADALHTLYSKAATFITDEAALDAAIAAEFDAPFYRANPDRSVWDQQGFPEGIDWLVAQQATSRQSYRAAMGRTRDFRGVEPDDRLLRRGRERAERLVDTLLGAGEHEGPRAGAEGSEQGLGTEKAAEAEKH